MSKSVADTNDSGDGGLDSFLDSLDLESSDGSEK